jgi:hypothetical protein
VVVVMTVCRTEEDVEAELIRMLEARWVAAAEI